MYSTDHSVALRDRSLAAFQYSVSLASIEKGSLVILEEQMGLFYQSKTKKFADSQSDKTLLYVLSTKCCDSKTYLCH